jgi:hypothetical protein
MSPKRTQKTTTTRNKTLKKKHENTNYNKYLEFEENVLIY